MAEEDHSPFTSKFCIVLLLFPMGSYFYRKSSLKSMISNMEKEYAVKLITIQFHGLTFKQ